MNRDIWLVRDLNPLSGQPRVYSEIRSRLNRKVNSFEYKHVFMSNVEPREDNNKGVFECFHQW